MVDHEEFRNFCKSLDSCFEMMSRNTVKGDCLNIPNLEKEAITHIPETNEGRVAVSADMWMSSLLKKKGHLPITTHYINNSWRLQCRIIRYNLSLDF